MSHPLYNTYASGNQRATQRKYRLSGRPAERDPRTASPRLVPGSSFSSPGNAVTSANSGGIITPQLPQLMSFRPEPSTASIEEKVERSIEMHISRAREEMRLLGKPMQQPIDSRFTGTQRELLSSGSGMVSDPMFSTSASLGRRYPGVESGSSSLDWSSNYERPTADEPSKLYSSASSNYVSGVNGRFNASSDRERNISSILGLGDFDKPSLDKPAAPTEPNRQKYTSESASNILVHFGLEKEDLEHLISYPENQITPANLPFILRQIRLEKTKRVTTSAQSKPCPKPQSTRMTHSGGAGMRQEEILPAVRQPSNVIDYGHTGKYIGGAEEEIGRTSGSRDNSGGSGSTLPMDTYSSSRHGREPLKKIEVKSSALGFSRMQTQQPMQPVPQAIWPTFFPAAKSVPPASLMPSITDAMQRPVFIPVGPPPIVSPPALPQPIPDLMGFIHGPMPPSNRQPPAKAAVSKGLPTAAMMHDYATATPRIFPHTCCLCNRECLRMEDWISHQNTSCHLESCKVLRKQYPEWDGEVAISAAGKDASPSPSASSQTSQHRQKARHGSRSRLPSPLRYHRSEGRQERHSRRSRSPHGARYTRRSRSRSPSPRYDRPTSSRYRSRSRSPERPSSPRRRDDRRSSPRRSLERRSSPRWSDERRSPKRKSSNTDNLIKKLLETSAVQSLSTQLDLETVVKALAPALMAKLVKMNSTLLSSSSSASSPTKKPSKATPSLQKSESEESSPPTEVKLEGVNYYVSHHELLAAMKNFGKTKI